MKKFYSSNRGRLNGKCIRFWFPPISSFFLVLSPFVSSCVEVNVMWASPLPFFSFCCVDFSFPFFRVISLSLSLVFRLLSMSLFL
jgi:hypothetical protein